MIQVLFPNIVYNSSQTYHSFTKTITISYMWSQIYILITTVFLMKCLQYYCNTQNWKSTAKETKKQKHAYFIVISTKCIALFVYAATSRLSTKAFAFLPLVAVFF